MTAKSILLILLTAPFFSAYCPTKTKELKPGDTAPTFTLKNVDGKMVSLNDFKDKKGVIIIFTCNHCPYAVAYEDRIIDLNKKYAADYPVIAINPNDPEVQPADSYAEMVIRAKEKGFTFPYLIDEGQKIYPAYGAVRTPHVYLLKNEAGKFKVAYIGAIDDNYEDASAVTVNYIDNAIARIAKGQAPDPDNTKAIGCTIKKKK